MFKSKVTQEQLELMGKMQDAGRSFRQIAEATGFSVGTVHYKLAQHQRKTMLVALSVPKQKETLKFAAAAKAVTPKTAIVTRIKFEPPPYAPICAASMTGTYKGDELKYRR